MKYVIFDGKFMPSHIADELRRGRARSSLPAPMIIRDQLDGVKNPVDGKTYDSKAAYYQAVKEAGCEIVGNEAEKLMGASRPKSTIGRAAVQEAVQKLRQGYKPAPLEQATKEEREIAGLETIDRAPSPWWRNKLSETNG